LHPERHELALLRVVPGGVGRTVAHQGRARWRGAASLAPRIHAPDGLGAAARDDGKR
jgi:hypothetical protein